MLVETGMPRAVLTKPLRLVSTRTPTPYIPHPTPRKNPRSMGYEGSGIYGVGVWQGVIPCRPCRRQNSGFSSGGGVQHKRPAMQLGVVKLVRDGNALLTKPLRLF